VFTHRRNLEREAAVIVMPKDVWITRGQLEQLIIRAGMKTGSDHMSDGALAVTGRWPKDEVPSHKYRIFKGTEHRLAKAGMCLKPRHDISTMKRWQSV
jgi:hypothetical protein